MYAWIWRHLPFGLPGKLTGSVLLATGVFALLWFFVFPWAEPLLPFDDVQVNPDSGVPGGDPAAPGGAPGGDGGEPGGDEHDLPYSTETNNPAPANTPNG